MLLQRDRPETTFSRLLEGFAKAHPCVVIAAFVDDVGECIDYASGVPPYDAHVLAAHLASTTGELVRAHHERAGALVAWSCTTESRTLFVRRVTDEHCLALLAAPPPIAAATLRALPTLVRDLRAEAVLEPPSWDHLGAPVSVVTRRSSRWEHAPCSFVEASGRRREVEVLGRFDDGGASPLQRATCYRVRADGQELTLARALHDGRWYLR